jgi:predicted DNA-binding ribbon-helix-helix protein
MRSSVIKRSIVVQHRKTSVSLENEFWNAFREIARERDMTLSDLVASVDAERKKSNLSSAIRLFVLDVYRQICQRILNPRSPDPEPSVTSVVSLSSTARP